MKNPSDKSGSRNDLYEKIIGLGEKSMRKSHYPQLRQKLLELEGINRNLEHEIGERRQREQELSRSYESQRILNDLLKRSLEPVPLDDLLRIILDGILSFSCLENTGSAAIYCIENDSDVLCLKHSKSSPGVPAPSCDRIPFGHCFCGQAAQKRQIISSVHEDSDMADHKHYSVPICLENKTIGLICIVLPKDHEFDYHEESFLGAIADTLAGIIQHQRMSKEKSKIERQLYQNQKIEAIGVLSAGIAHDFNNLLTPILGYTEMALLKLPKDDHMANNLNQVIKAALLAKDLVRQILTLSRQSDPELKPLSLHKVVSETLKLLRSAIPCTIEIKNRVEASQDTILGDFTQIHQVIMNLCINAYHAMKETGGILAVGLRTLRIEDNNSKAGGLSLAEGTYQVLEVSDTGTGMSQTTLARIFDPYFTTKGKDEGTGLGLSVVLGIIKSYGGDITVFSELGQGTTFRVYLPCMNTGKVLEAECVWQPMPSGDEHVMVVDDEKVIVQMMKAMLIHRGYTVTGCTGSEEALERFRSNPLDVSLVITDMAMPRMTGAQLAQELRQIRPDIPMILCTGLSEIINEQKIKTQGFQRFLMKPIIMSDLCRTVRDVLDSAKAAGSSR